MQGIQLDNSSTENFSTTRVFSMRTLIKKIKPLVLMESEFEFRKKKSILKRFSLEISEHQDTDSREKNKDFLLGYSSTIALFSVEILMEETELVVAQN